MLRAQNYCVIGGLALSLVAGRAGTASATVITFDDLLTPVGSYFAPIPTGYAGLNWSNFFYINVTQQKALYGVSGYTYSLVSGSQVAYNGNGNLASASGTAFNLSSGYFTGAWNDGLVITVNGYRNGSLVGSDTFSVNSTSHSFENLNLNQVDTVNFTSSGGTPNPTFAALGNGTQFALDDLTINGSVPEPTSCAIGAIASLRLLSRRRRRA